MKSLQSRLLLTALAWLLLALSGMHNASAAQTSVVTEAIINLPVADAWRLFTSEAGLKSLGYTHASVELRLDGRWQGGGGAVALRGLDAQILSFDPERMLSARPADQWMNTRWTVLYFTAMGGDMTQLRWLEFFPENQRAAVDDHQRQVRNLFEQLIRRYAPECAVCKLERVGAGAEGE